MNRRLIMAERDLIEPAGLPDRPWYRHVIYAPGLYTGYGVKTIPGVREAVDAGNFTHAPPNRRRSSSARCSARTHATRRRLIAMAIDKQGTGLTVLRICLGVFFIFEGLGKIRWFTRHVAARRACSRAGRRRRRRIGELTGIWSGSRVPGVTIFARLVPLGEMTSGLALVLGFWTPLFAFVAFFMALNFQIASGAHVQVQLSDQRIWVAGARFNAGARARLRGARSRQRRPDEY